jgi:glycosyltransferase involved in cell wall biosynthesis
MRTLLSINNYYYYRGGAETVCLEHNRMFEEAGWAVVPFAMKNPHNLPSRWSGYFVEDIEFGNSYSLGEKLIRATKVIYSFEARRNLGRLIDAARPDISHAHNIYHHISPSILGLLRQRQIPVVLTLHDLKIACPAYNMLARDGICERCRGGRVYNVLIHRCIKQSATLSAIALAETVVNRLIGSYQRCVSRFVVPSRFYIDKLCEWGWPRSKFTHVPNFVEAERYRPQYEPGRAFIYAGRLSREKGLATLIQAAAASGSRLMLAGTGHQLEELRELAVKLKADVTFLGFLTGDALHAAIRSARAMVLPSEWYENAPMSVLEAYALGKPVIGARIGGIPELLQENGTGQGFVSGSVESLTAVLRNMTESSDAAIEEMGRRARLWVEKEYSASRYRTRIASIYGELGVSDDMDRRAPALT